MNTDLSPGAAHECMLNPHPNKPNYNLVCMRDSELPSFYGNLTTMLSEIDTADNQIYVLTFVTSYLGGRSMYLLKSARG